MEPDAIPGIVERLRGTVLRLEERTNGLTPDVLTARSEGRWSIQEHAGHLADLENLWLGRLDDFEQEGTVLREADLQNRATWEADHNARALGDVIERFRALRERLVARVSSMTEGELARMAIHPRLRQPMTVADHCFFVAEHDDHHLAAITELRSAQGGRAAGGSRRGMDT